LYGGDVLKPEVFCFSKQGDAFNWSVLGSGSEGAGSLPIKELFVSVLSEGWKGIQIIMVVFGT
jgi:uncharacterized phage infection (PIP) family protein YhgE